MGFPDTEARRFRRAIAAAEDSSVVLSICGWGFPACGKKRSRKSIGMSERLIFNAMRCRAAHSG